MPPAPSRRSRRYLPSTTAGTSGPCALAKAVSWCTLVPMPLSSAEMARDYPRLLSAMNEVLRVLSTGGGEEDALRRSFEHAAEGFGADKALLLLVVGLKPLHLQQLWSRGLTSREVQACERGESVPGVSASVIRSAITGRQLEILQNPLARLDRDATAALAGQSYSVLCSPVLDPIRDIVLAVMYFQRHAPDEARAYKEADA